jgi:hypothetical protein
MTIGTTCCAATGESSLHRAFADDLPRSARRHDPADEDSERSQLFVDEVATLLERYVRRPG